MSVIETKALSKSFGRKRAVFDVGLEVPEGAIYGLVGTNGAGKSTLLKLLAGLLLPNSGVVNVAGRELAPGECADRVGALIEEPALYPKMDAFENLMNRALVLGLPDPEAACREALETVGIAEKVAGNGHWRTLWPRGDYAEDLSLGMKKRLGVALALIGNPEILLLDEPFSGIDPKGARSLRECIARLSRERGVTVVVSSHTIGHLERMCTHYGIMRDGRLVRQEEAKALLALRETCLEAEVDEPERAVAVLHEELPGLRVTAMSDGKLRATTGIGELPDRKVFSQTLSQAGLTVLGLRVIEPDLEAELVGLMG